MYSILQNLYTYAMDSGKNSYLDQDELRDYRSASHSIEKLSDELEQLLEGESLRVFKLYVENRNEEENYEDLSTFRVGLAIGLKLGMFGMTER